MLNLSETPKLDHKARPNLGCSWEKEKRQTEEHVTQGIESRRQDHEYHLLETGKQSPWQIWLQISRRGGVGLNK